MSEVKLGTIVYGRDIGKSAYKYIWSACEICGVPRWVELQHGKPKDTICWKCSRERVTGNQTGKNNPNWKGGSKRNDQGYVLLHMPEHPLANSDGYVRRARLVLTEKLGRPLKEGFVAHHINGVKDDDRPGNLIEVSVQEHELIHAQREKPRDNQGRFINA